MKVNKRIPKSGMKTRLGQALLSIGITAALVHPFTTVEAGVLDRVKDMYQLPEHVESIQKEFDATKQQLEEQRNKLAESVQQSREAIDLLNAQNKQLLEQNEALQSRIQMMEQTSLDKKAQTRKITSIALTVIFLIIGYFLIGRLIRILVWRRQNSNLRQ
ncbi:hypothetical protein [Paenibacillus sp. UNC451MF]|uniref:hypothetical protein n=1 Tax=Paenibacillus sp. UNC451MF TaxID=1449063 RepID=UPI00048CA775|nr:hypothetical protein [Paenibacillus sp. UNC451MF]